MRVTSHIPRSVRNCEGINPHTPKWGKGVCNKTFETLKTILVKTLMLKLPDFDKDFEIHFDASNYVIGGVLMQDGRLVAFESKKLSETK